MVHCPACSREVAVDETVCAACGADASIWLGRGGETFGPYSLTELRQSQAEGRLGETDMVMIGGSGEWRPVADFLNDEPLAAPVPSSPFLPESPEVSADEPETDLAPAEAPPRRTGARPAAVLALLLMVTLMVAGPIQRYYHQRDLARRMTTQRNWQPGRPATVMPPAKTTSG